VPTAWSCTRRCRCVGKELLVVARAKPGGVLYGSGGSGSAAHLAMVYFELLAKVNLHIFRTRARAGDYDLIAGQTSTMITGMAALMPHIKSQKLRIIGVGTASAWPVLPDVPTIAKPACRATKQRQWYGILAPAATPRDMS